MRRMHGMDGVLLQMETPTMHLHVVGVLMLDPSGVPGGWSFDRLVETVEKRIHLLTPFRWRLVPVPGGLDTPRWIDDPDFDLLRHVHRVTLAPGGAGSVRGQLEEFVGEVAGQPLDRSRPLWDMFVVEGLADGSVAVVTKLHHSFMDGGAGGEVMASLFDLTPEGDLVPPPDEPWDPEPSPDAVRVLFDSMDQTADRISHVPATVARTITGLIGRARTARVRRRDVDKPPMFAPRTPFNGPLTAARSVAFARCSLADVKAAKTAFGVTVNDVVLAATASTLRTYLLERDALPDRALIASVPVSLRSENEAKAFGNRTSNLFVTLPVEIADPVERLMAVNVASSAAKDIHRAMGADLLGDWADLAPAPLISFGSRAYGSLGLSRLLPPVMNLVVSNVAGPPLALYMAGAAVTGVYPFGPLMEGTGLNLTVLSRCGDLDVGVIACPDLVDDPDAIVDGFAAAVSELLALGSQRP